MMYRNKKQSGIGMVEIIVALGLIGVAFAGISTISQFSIRTQRALAMRQRAALLAVEGLEVAKFERDANWTTFSTRPISTPLYPEFVGMVAQLTAVDPGDVDGIYAREVTLSRVYRDLAGNIAVAGTEDADARDVEVTVDWTDPFGAARTFTVSAYLMRI